MVPKQCCREYAHGSPNSVADEEITVMLLRFVVFRVNIRVVVFRVGRKGLHQAVGREPLCRELAHGADGVCEFYFISKVMSFIVCCVLSFVSSSVPAVQTIHPYRIYLQWLELASARNNTSPKRSLSALGQVSNAGGVIAFARL